MDTKAESRLSTRADSQRHWSLVAAVAAVPLLAALPARIARAQFPVGNAGHANDANNQVGSGGYNDRSRVGSNATSNDIIYGNVTGGRAFRGALESTDPRAFRGQTFAGSADTFIGDSSGTALRSTPSAAAIGGYRSIQPYYSDARGVAPPPNYVPVVNGGGYVPAGSFQASRFSTQLSDSTDSGGYRTGAGYGQPNMNPSFGLNGPYAPYGTLIGPLDSPNQQSLLVSPLSGIQQAPLNPGESYNLSRANAMLLQAGGRIDPQTLQKLQQELRQQGESPDGQPANANPNEISKPMVQALEAPVNEPLGTSVTAKPVGTQQPLSNGVGTQEGMHRTLSSPSVQETPILGSLKDRLERYNGNHTPSDAELENTFQQQSKAAAAAKAKAAAGATGTAAAPGTPGTPAGSTRAAAPGTIAPGTVSPGVNLTPLPSAPKADTGASGKGTKTEPVKITSLATGVRANGFAGLLRAAEEMMKQGKYTSAVDQYTLAAQIAPNNPLIPLGLANAELGGASYRDAELNLRQAFSAEPALLHAQFDLNSLIGQQRVKTISDDLKELAAKEPTAEMPAFLLAYISYNTGHEAEAMNYLKDVEKREGHPDSVASKMRDHWYAPTTKPAMPAMNK